MCSTASARLLQFDRGFGLAPALLEAAEIQRDAKAYAHIAIVAVLKHAEMTPEVNQGSGLVVQSELDALYRSRILTAAVYEIINGYLRERSGLIVRQLREVEVGIAAVRTAHVILHICKHDLGELSDNALDGDLGFSGRFRLCLGDRLPNVNIA